MWPVVCHNFFSDCLKPRLRVPTHDKNKRYRWVFWLWIHLKKNDQLTVDLQKLFVLLLLLLQADDILYGAMFSIFGAIATDERILSVLTAVSVCTCSIFNGAFETVVKCEADTACMNPFELSITKYCNCCGAFEVAALFIDDDDDATFNEWLAFGESGT